MKNLIALVAVAGAASAANAQLGIAVAADGNNNFLSQSITVNGGMMGDGVGQLNSWAPGDMWGIASRTNQGTNGLPFTIADDSNGTFTGDSLGIIDATDNGFFFGAVDTFNGDNPANTGAATWTFDITGATGISVSADFAAMGDFEVGQDDYNFTYSIDGSTPSPLFSSTVQDQIDQNYTLASGTVVNLNDPIDINGTLLNNVFQTLSAGVSGSGSVLTISLVGGGDGGSEGFAFRNLTVVPTPGSAALVGLAGLAGLRRRRA